MGLHAFKNVVATFALFPVFEEANCIDLFKYCTLHFVNHQEEKHYPYETKIHSVNAKNWKRFTYDKK